jgi:hypothetical protein
VNLPKSVDCEGVVDVDVEVDDKDKFCESLSLHDFNLILQVPQWSSLAQSILLFIFFLQFSRLHRPRNLGCSLRRNDRN